MKRKTFLFPSLCLFSLSLAYLYSCSKGDSIAERLAESSPPPVTPSTCSGTPGPLFSAVKSLLNSRCVSCHNSTISNGGMNWTVECNIVSNKALIKLKAVDEGSMPPTGPLSASEKAVITTWINAGGRYTD